MAKDFRSRSVELKQAYGSLKSFLTGPCKHNQLHMAMETECVLVINRVLRELYKDADKHYRKREEKVKKKQRSQCPDDSHKKIFLLIRLFFFFFFFF